MNTATHKTTLEKLHAKICKDLERPMQDIHDRMLRNEATSQEWQLWQDYRRTQLLYPPVPQ